MDQSDFSDMDAFLLRVDSWCSLAAARGLDDELRDDLRRLSLEARNMRAAVGSGDGDK